MSLKNLTEEQAGFACCSVIVIAFLLIFVPLVIVLWRWALG